MFFTRENPERSYYSEEDGVEHVWNRVDHYIHIPWFYVSMKRVYQSEAMTGMILVANGNEFEEILLCQTPTRYVTRIELVSPKHTNGGDSWKMDTLEVLFKAKDESGYDHYVCQLNNGETYVLSSEALCNLTIVSTLYPAS